MTPADIDRVFGRSRLRMVTGDHVEVFREAAARGERRRYTKRFLATPDGDFRAWTEREWRILARLVGHGLKPVPEVVQFDSGSADRSALVQTYDAGITVDHWATLLPLERDGALFKNVFEDCAHWWALARHTLLALDAIHELGLVHLDLKADNVCIPVGPLGFDPCAGSERSLHPRFGDITLIDFAFSLVSGEPLKSALPMAAQPEYVYQSPRLLHALEVGRSGDLGETRHLDWRCDFFSLAAMLSRYLPEPGESAGRAWTSARHARASAFMRRLIEVHDLELPARRPHAQLVALATETLAQPDLRLSLQRGWTLALDAATASRAAPTPITRVAPPLVAYTTPVRPRPAEPRRGQPRMSPVAASSDVALAASVTPIASPPHTPTPHALAAELEPLPMHVKQSDIDARNAAARKRMQRPAFRLWWGTAGLATAVAAAASVPWLRATWSSFADAAPPVEAALATRHAPRTPTSRPLTPPTLIAVAPARARAASEVDAPAHAIVTRLAAAKAAALPADTGPTVPPKLPSVSGTTPAPGRPAAHAAQALAPRTVPPSPAPTARPANSVAVSQAPRAWPVARSSHNAAADAAATARLALLAKAQDNAAVLMRARAARAALTVPVPATVANPFPARPTDGATPWAMAGRPPPMAVPMPSLAPAPAAPAPQAGGLQTASSDARPVEPTADYDARADELMSAFVPQVAQRADRAVARTLFLASRSGRVVGDAEVAGAAAQLGRGPADAPRMSLAPREADGLHAAARGEFARHGASREAMLLQVRAFGANPIDPAGAGYLAFLLVRQHPAKPEAARQLALYALAMHGERYPLGRPEDWSTLAVANALLGRDRDAQNALLVSLAAAPNVERQCRAAVDLVALYGERLRAPAEAMLHSAHDAVPRGSPFCEWPPYWAETTSAR